MSTALIVACAWIGAACPRSSQAALAPVEIFDGESLQGWTQRGGAARYAVVDGTIVGTAVASSPNSFLCTERLFADFELELEFQVADGLNSGVQVRSHARSEARNAVVYGYQVEIDPSERAWTGGLYEESGRGWLDDLAGEEAARAAFRPGEWNRMRVRCEGDWIRTWINDVPVTDHLDARELEGFIGLQVHNVPPEAAGKQVSWRSIRLRDLGAHAWVPLWTGQDLDGWEKLGAGGWTLSDEVLVGTHSASETQAGLLLGPRLEADFGLRLNWRSSMGGSSIRLRGDVADDLAGL
jgi:hypothetical protein